jgi:vitamin B12 transporter
MVTLLRPLGRSLLLSACCLSAPTLHAVIVHGVVTDPLNAPISGATVALVENGKVVLTVRAGADGSYQMSVPDAGRFYVLAGGISFRQLTTEGFYGAPLDDVEKNVTLEPETVRQAIVVTATGTPLPQAQVSTSITRLGILDLQNFANVSDVLRQVPGFHVVQTGQQGGVTSLFIRGGNSDDNKVLLDGVPLEDVGGTFDFANLSTTGVEAIEAERGPNSVVYGADAGDGVVALTTPRGSTPFPSLIYQGDGGNFGTYRNEVQAGGTRNALDYYGGFSAHNTANTVPNSEYHDMTSSANLGYALGAATTVRVTVRNSDSGTGVPGQYAFYQVAGDSNQLDQDTFASGTIDHTFSDRWHGFVEYGLARKREQFNQFAPEGQFVDYPDYGYGVYLGQNVTIAGANGYSVNGQAILNYTGTYPSRSDSVSNRDSLHAQTDYAFTPHLTGVLGFNYEDERGAYRYPVYGEDEAIERTNYDYTAQLQGDFKNRLFYTLGGGVEKNQLYGTVGAPHLGASYYIERPGAGMVHGTRLNFNFSRGYKEPTLFQQYGSLYNFLLANGGAAAAQQYGIRPIGAALTRSYDGGVEQSLFSERVLVKATYFHNEFGDQIEAVSSGFIPQLLPQLSAAQQASLEALLNGGYVSPDLNSLAFRAQGVETEVQYGIRKNIFFRGGYTYLDSVVQHSFSSDVASPTFNTAFNFGSIPIGVYSPLVGARPFRRPPHTGFVTATYTKDKYTAVVSGAFASRSDDSTFLGFSDANGGNSLLLPNRNLDSAYAKVDVNLVYQWKPYLGVYTQLDNALSQQHISPIGSPSLPFTARTGIRLVLGKTVK